MFIVSVTYLQSLDLVDQHLPAHVEFLERHFASGTFVASGRKVPRSGGIIMAAGVTLEQLESILREDPFRQHGIAAYEITEFTPNRTAPGYELLLNL